jgi:hypothetical protein
VHDKQIEEYELKTKFLAALYATIRNYHAELTVLPYRKQSLVTPKALGEIIDCLSLNEQNSE